MSSSTVTYDLPRRGGNVPDTMHNSPDEMSNAIPRFSGILVPTVYTTEKKCSVMDIAIGTANFAKYFSVRADICYPLAGAENINVVYMPNKPTKLTIRCAPGFKFSTSAAPFIEKINSRMFGVIAATNSESMFTPFESRKDGEFLFPENLYKLLPKIVADTSEKTTIDCRRIDESADGKAMLLHRTRAEPIVENKRDNNKYQSELVEACSAIATSMDANRNLQALLGIKANGFTANDKKSKSAVKKIFKGFKFPKVDEHDRYQRDASLCHVTVFSTADQVHAKKSDPEPGDIEFTPIGSVGSTEAGMRAIFQRATKSGRVFKILCFTRSGGFVGVQYDDDPLSVLRLYCHNQIGYMAQMIKMSTLSTDLANAQDADYNRWVQNVVEKLSFPSYFLYKQSGLNCNEKSKTVNTVPVGGGDQFDFFDEDEKLYTTNGSNKRERDNTDGMRDD